MLDVSNREGNRKRTSGRGGVSLISGRLLTEGPVGQGSWMLAGRRTYLDGVFSALRARGEDIPLNYYFYDLNGNINQRRGDDTYTAGAYWGQDDLRVELEDDEESFVDMRWGNRALTARWTRAFSPASVRPLHGRWLVVRKHRRASFSRRARSHRQQHPRPIAQRRRGLLRQPPSHAFFGIVGHPI